MNSRIEDLISQARGERSGAAGSMPWEPSQTSRGLSSALARQKVRALRARVDQRVLVVAVVSALLAVALLRASSGPMFEKAPKVSAPNGPRTSTTLPLAHRPEPYSKPADAVHAASDPHR